MNAVQRALDRQEESELGSVVGMMAERRRTLYGLRRRRTETEAAVNTRNDLHGRDRG